MSLATRVARLETEAAAQPGEDLPPIWQPLQGPQTRALASEADELFFGGAAGGAKTDTLIGLGLTRHRRSIIFRREYPQLKGIIDRLRELVPPTRTARCSRPGTARGWRCPGSTRARPPRTASR